MENSKIIFIGIDDTDDLDSPGTGQRARELAFYLAGSGLADARDATRHQFLKSPLIASTSHNSGACLAVQLRNGVRQGELQRACSEFIQSVAALSSDPGLCIAPADAVSRAVERFGARARFALLRRWEAEMLAEEAGLYLVALGGDGSGAIGALASVGQRSAGGPALLIWLPELYGLAGRSVPVEELTERVGIERLITPDGRQVGRSGERVAMGDWPRPVLLAGSRVLLVEEGASNDDDAEWRVLAKPRVKQYWG
ncbi:hypothetical protein OL229_13215 [Neisseriaceae bacterium JH1-16]|nr:hypothetical protein [Neisseriaceae bacterium JH1-16]